MGARERLLMEGRHVLYGGKGRAPRGAAMGARERLPVGQLHAYKRETCGSSRAGKLGDSERLPLNRSETFVRVRHENESSFQHFCMSQIMVPSTSPSRPRLSPPQHPSSHTPPPCCSACPSAPPPFVRSRSEPRKLPGASPGT